MSSDAASPDIPIARVNELIHRFGESQKREMRAEKRSGMSSVLFDLPRRSPLGWRCLHDNQDPFLRELAASVSPEELGRRMRVPGSRPYALQPFILLCSHLGHRQVRMLEMGLEMGDPFPEERREELVFLIDFWARLQGAYRSDEALLPAEAGGSLPILDPGAVEDLAARAAPTSAEAVAAVRRMAATLELYGFMVHGEQRDGIFGHGPYRREDGTVLFCREFNDLRNDYLPWASTAVENPFDTVVVAYLAHDVEVICDMFGTMRVEPHDFEDRLDGMAVLTREDGALRGLDAAEVAAVQRGAADAQEELFMKAVEWDDTYKIAYGAPLFANHLKPFFDLAELPDREAMSARLMAACEETARRHAGEMVGGEIPSIWGHFAAGEDDLFWPIVD